MGLVPQERERNAITLASSVVLGGLPSPKLSSNMSEAEEHLEPNSYFLDE